MTHGSGIEARRRLGADPFAQAAFEAVRSAVVGAGERFDVAVSKSQIAFRRKRGFAYIWFPEQYLTNPAAKVVLTIALGRHDPSPRWKSVVHASAAHWIHHLEIRDVSDIDAEVAAWLAEASARAG